MKKTLIIILIALVSLTSLFASGEKEVKDSNKISVGATPEPHAAMLNLIKEDLEAQGYQLEIIEFTDYVTPNQALESGEIDANFFQHLPYLETFNAEHNTSLVSAGGIHIEPMALYSSKVSSIDNLKNGASIAIPNDPTNEGRALLLLESAGLIKLNDNAGLEATPFDIKENPRKFKFEELEAATLPRIIKDVDAAVINGNYAIPAGLIAAKDGLVLEGADSPYVNVLAIKKGSESKAIDALVKALKSEKVAAWVQERYPNGEVVLVD